MLGRRLTPLLLAVLVAGCAHPVSPAPANGTFVRGTAKIISMEPEIGHVLLQFDGRQIDAYWQTQSYVAQGGALVQNDPLKPAVGQYAEPVAKLQTLHAKPGDTILFVGMTTPSGILLNSVAVAR